MRAIGAIGAWVATASLATAAEVELSATQAARSVVFLHAPSSKQSGSQSLDIGTGFLVDLNNRMFLVTAEHVAKLMSSAASLTFGVDKDVARTVSMSQLTGSTGAPAWVVHPVADVAVLRLQPVGDAGPLLAGRGFPLAWIPTAVLGANETKHQPK
jgi:hypothetical protein